MKRARLAILLAAALPLATSGRAEIVRPLGEDFQVNSYTTDRQYWPVLDVEDDGDFVVAWSSEGSSPSNPNQDTSDLSIQARRFASDGSPRGLDFQVNTATTRDQRNPAIAVGPDGGFVVVWESSVASATNPSPDQVSVRGRRFASDGAAIGSDFRLNAYTTGFQSLPSLDIEADGDFVVVWMSSTDPLPAPDYLGIQGRRFASDGTPRGSDFQINGYITGIQGGPFVDVAPAGDFVVVWESDTSAPSNPDPDPLWSVQARRFASDATPLGFDFQVNTYTPLAQALGRVGIEADGDFLIVWESDGADAADPDPEPSGERVVGRRFASDGSARGSDFQLSEFTTLDRGRPALAARPDGDFTVVWEDAAGRNLQARHFASDGTPRGAALRVNSYTTLQQDEPAIAVTARGDVVVTWTSFGSGASNPAPDRSSTSIQARRFVLAPVFADGFEVGSASAWSDCVGAGCPL